MTKIGETYERKAFKIGDTIAVSLPSPLREKYYKIEDGDIVEIGVYSSDKGLHFSFWKKGA